MENNGGSKTNSATNLHVNRKSLKTPSVYGVIQQRKLFLEKRGGKTQ